MRHLLVLCICDSCNRLRPTCAWECPAAVVEASPKPCTAKISCRSKRRCPKARRFWAREPGSLKHPTSTDSSSLTRPASLIPPKLDPPSCLSQEAESARWWKIGTDPTSFPHLSVKWPRWCGRRGGSPSRSPNGDRGLVFAQKQPTFFSGRRLKPVSGFFPFRLRGEHQKLARCSRHRFLDDAEKHGTS